MPDLMTTTVKPVALIILDGWGVSQKTEANALALARLPFYNSLLRNCPWTLLSASGEDTGLPDNQMGNSEVGHMNLGAGRIVYQDFTRINRAIRDGNPRRLLRDEPGDHPGAAQGPLDRRPPAPAGAPLGRRGAQPHLPSRGNPGTGEEGGPPAGVRARVPGRAGHAPAERPRLPQDRRGADAPAWCRDDRHRDGAVLRHGPRPAVGPRGQGLRGNRRRNWRASKVGRGGRDGELCGERNRRVRGPRRHRGPTRPSDREH